MNIRITTVLLVTISALGAGCSSIPKDDSGRDIVYLQSVAFDVSNPDLGLFVPWLNVPANAIAKVGAAVFAGTKVAKALEQKKPPMVYVTYSHKEGEITPLNTGKIFSRPVWEGMPELVTKRWYQLAEDDEGKYLIPCEPSCQPAPSAQLSD
jgi:hypothetical protein